jgi:Mannosyltransferase putative
VPRGWTGRFSKAVGGLVVVAGGARIFTNAYVLLHMLRHVLRSSLPVELWYFGQREISPAMAAAVEPLDVRLVDANPLIAASGANVRDGWQLKCFALVHSRFAEVLLLDADQVPNSDPAACFDWPQFAETGAVFWPDIVDLRKDNAIWRLFGLEPRRAVSLESGQLLVDRRRHSTALAAALKLNEAADDVYQLIYGDKDTYLVAWELLGASYALVPHRPYSDEFMLVQRDFDGAALFQHRTNAKWQYGAEQRKLYNFRYEEECHAALADLRLRWGGRVFTAREPHDGSAGARGSAQVGRRPPRREGSPASRGDRSTRG